MPKNKFQEVIFTIIMVFFYGLCDDLLQHLSQHRRNVK